MLENKFPGKDISDEDLKTKFPLVAKNNKDHKSVLHISDVEIGGNTLPIFAGPNMVESEKLIVETALSVKKSGAHFLRGGAFKPLTFPYRSEKYNETREEGLKWLKKANIQKSNTVNDHIIGVTSIGEHTIENFKKSYLKIKEDKNWLELDYPYILESINKMCDDWLPNHLWLWAMCRLTKEEHDSGEDGIRVERGTSMKIDDKRKLKHYNDAGIIIEKYK